jgi:hypothetical protein
MPHRVLSRRWVPAESAESALKQLILLPLGSQLNGLGR